LGLIDLGGGHRELDVAPHEHPGTLMLPVLATPRALVLPGEKRRATFMMWLALPSTEIFDLPQRHNAWAVKLGSFEILSFCRLLAKISHCAAFLDLDWTNSWQPLLSDLILGRTETYDDLVGGTDQIENEQAKSGFPVFFESVDIGSERYLVAQLRLFAWMGAPTYRILVGRKK
jgi:hypothetical protein